MYQNLIVYLVVILVYTTHLPPEQPLLPPGLAAVLLAASYPLYYLAARLRFVLPTRRRLPDQALAAALDREQTLLTAAAVALFTLAVYVLNLKALLGTVPLLTASNGLATLAAFLLFLLYQVIIWNAGHRASAGRFALPASPWEYCRRKALFAGGIIAPWLVLLLLTDLLEAVFPALMPRLLAAPWWNIALFGCFMLLLALSAPPLTIRLWGCRPLPEGPIRRRIADLCRREGIGYRKIMLWPGTDGRMATAAVMGPLAWARYLLVTPELLELLTPDEVEAVMAHEIGHVRHRHLLIYMLFFLSLFLLNYAFLDLFIGWLLTAAPIHRLLHAAGGQQTSVLSLLTMIPLLVIYLVYFRYIFGFFLRHFERQADLHVFAALGTAAPLAGAFAKLAWLTGDDGSRSNWHHYTLPERLAFLEHCRRHPEAVSNYHRRLKTMLGIFAAAVVILGIFGYRLHAAGIRQSLDNRYLLTAIERHLAKHPDDGTALFAAGSLAYEEGNQAEGRTYFERALGTGFRDPELLNNLAWLLLTADKPEIRDGERGFALAREAAALKPAAHILDTLAEAYWRRGFPCTALEIERQILAGGPENRDVYHAQEEKFARDCGGQQPAAAPPPER
ncbi:MAG: M48 family metalloprotease [Deltaproteobacteria bacterium]|nr:M48 family metalloprotease [Candidatus Anaeroferrophillacea bacterium]